MSTTWNIIIAIIGLAIVAAPIFMDLKKRQWRAKTLAYRATIVALLVAYTIGSVYKIAIDDKSMDNLIGNSNKLIVKVDTLKDSVSALRKDIIYRKGEYDTLLSRLKKLDISVRNNRPYVIKTFNTNIGRVGTLNQN